MRTFEVTMAADGLFGIGTDELLLGLGALLLPALVIYWVVRLAVRHRGRDARRR